jgi:uncharacterized protein YbjT (DUF2867 family)
MKRVLVAGATGYVGGFVAREFKARGYFVRALARSPRKLNGLRESLDEVVEGEVTFPISIRHVCDGIDVVFSSVGITRQQDGLTFRDVDYQANKNLLEVARKAGVKKFVYVSVFDAPRHRHHLEIMAAHEAFVTELKASGIDYAIVRPTGYFSDMNEVFQMARRGRVWLVGSGETRVNPIHGADLAVACVDAAEGPKTEIDVGGPQAMTWRVAAKLAFRALGRPARITRVPQWLVWTAVRLMRLYSRHQSDLLAFFATMATTDVVAPPTGTHTLETHYRALGGTR